MREVSSERYKNFYPGSTSGIYQHRQGAADFLSDFLVYPIPVELRREIPIGWRLLALLERDEIRIRKEINYPFSKVFLFLEKSYRKNRPVFSTLYRIHYGWALLIATFNSLSVNTPTDDDNVLLHIFKDGEEDVNSSVNLTNIINSRINN